MHSREKLYVNVVSMNVVKAGIKPDLDQFCLADTVISVDFL